MNLDYNIIEFIAKHIKKNVRDLEGAVIRILAKSSLLNKEIDFQLVKEVIKERIGSSFSPELTIEDVVKKVSEICNISETEIVGKSRKMEVAEARQISMYLSRNIIGTSLASIGVFFGGRDHSTVIHAVKTVKEKISKTDKTRKQVDMIKQELDFSLI